MAKKQAESANKVYQPELLNVDHSMRHLSINNAGIRCIVIEEQSTYKVMEVLEVNGEVVVLGNGQTIVKAKRVKRLTKLEYDIYVNLNGSYYKAELEMSEDVALCRRKLESYNPPAYVLKLEGYTGRYAIEHIFYQSLHIADVYVPSAKGHATLDEVGIVCINAKKNFLIKYTIKELSLLVDEDQSSCREIFALHKDPREVVKFSFEDWIH